MCSKCDILNVGSRDPKVITPEYNALDSLIAAVYSGVVNPDELPQTLYTFTAMVLMGEQFIGFGLPSDFEEGTSRYALAVKAKNNLSLFSGAKTFQNVVDLSLAVFDEDGQVQPFSEFKKRALEINDKYNVEWLKTEQQAAIRQSQAIENWTDITEDKDLFPLLQYSTVGDARVRDSHRRIDEVIKPVGDPFWDKWFPPNGFRCRCIVKKLRNGEVTNIKTPDNDDVNFDTNVGKTGLIFSKKHPYNDVPSQYKTAASNGFGFTVPTDKDIRDYVKERE